MPNLKQELVISETFKEKAKRDWREENYPAGFDNRWFSDIEKAANEAKVSNDLELLLCLKEMHRIEKQGQRRDAGGFERFLLQLIKYFYA